MTKMLISAIQLATARCPEIMLYHALKNAGFEVKPFNHCRLFHDMLCPPYLVLRSETEDGFIVMQGEEEINAYRQRTAS